MPEKIYNAIKDNRDLNYNPKYEANQEMTIDIISKEALALISALNLQYWCEDETEKVRLKEKYIENGKKEQEKYIYENLLPKETEEVSEKDAKTSQNEEIALIEIKESNVFLKLMKKVKNWYNKIVKKK